ncbi:LysR family transcriptional regulator [Aliagarivorans marinus]|uniref:LysR family transcriptional regulator n=1 Tax=Aliagarivorans marinus TaxID=561965 RepID=UPI0004148FBC|nr:LysR family transcriptional regulator [Aliagarivorans marinus]
MDVKVFKTFLEVAEVKHFGKAAENLYITQAAVSARIKHLEEYFGGSLFIRNRHGIQLTSAGERLVPYAQTLVRTLSQAKAELDIAHNQHVQLTLAGTANIWDAFLQSWLNTLIDAFPNYAFLAESSTREQIQRSLMERTLDIGITLDPLKADEIYSQQLADLSLQLVSTEQQSTEQALAESYVLVNWGTRFSVEHQARHPELAGPKLRTSDGRIALDYLLQKGGAAYLPTTLTQPFVESGQLFVLEQPQWQRPVYINYHRAAAKLEEIKRVEEIISQTRPATGYLISQASD